MQELAKAVVPVRVNPARGIAFAPRGNLVAVGYAGGVTLRDGTSGRVMRRLTAGYVYAVAFSPDGKWVVGGDEGKGTKIWEVASGRLVRSLPHSPSWIGGLAISPDGRLLAMEKQRTIGLFALQGGAERDELKGHVGRVKTVAFSPDGRLLVSTSKDGTVRAWDVTARKVVHRYNARDPENAIFAPDSQTVAIGDGQDIILWNARTGRLLARQKTPDRVFGLSFSPDGKILATCFAHAYLWDVASLRQLRRISIGVDKGWALAFSPDGKRLAVGGKPDP